MQKFIYLGISLVLCCFTVHAAVTSRDFPYEHNQVMLEGYLAIPEEVSKPRPGIIIVHDWMGLSSFTKEKADSLAKLGYVSFAADIYGKNVRPKNTQEAGEQSSLYKNNVKLMRDRVKRAYDVLLNQPEVDAHRVFVMGYCFGGTVALELARSGAPLAGTVSFHGGLSTPNIQDAKNIQGKVLVFHGGADPLVPPKEVMKFKQEMRDAKVEMTFVEFPDAKHAFTNPEADKYNNDAVGYHADADQQSWSQFLKFIKENSQKPVQ